MLHFNKNQAIILESNKYQRFIFLWEELHTLRC